MKTILKNGKIYIEKDNFMEAMLIENGIIKQIGINEDILKNQATQIIDLEGKTVLPGLNDSHLHISLVGEAMNSCDLTQAKSIGDIIKLGKDFIDKNKSIKVLYGRGWNQDYFTSGEKRLLSG